MDSSANRVPGAPAPPSQQDSQPTVRVMRLYKPAMPLIQTMPPLNSPTEGVKFSINPSFLLPDSFGEIFVGEVFSAYISIVGTETPFYDVSISVKLQTFTETIDLIDKSQYNSSVGILKLNEFLDIVVQHKLLENGSHTLRVVVNYAITKNENKILKKFYRFNVVEPLALTNRTALIKDKVVLQCEVINRSNHTIVLENTKFIPKVKSADIWHLPNPYSPKNLLENINIQDILSQYPILHPNDIYAFSMIISNTLNNSSNANATCNLGYPEIDWSLGMGESGTIRGSDVLFHYPLANTISVVCIQHPAVVTLGSTFEIILRVTNLTDAPVLAILMCSPELARSVADDIKPTVDACPISQSRNQKPPLPQQPPSKFSAYTTATSNQPSPSTAITTSIADISDNELQQGLCVIGLSVFDLGRLGPEEFFDTPITVYPLRTGLQQLPPLVISDRITKREFLITETFFVFVQDVQDDDDDDDDIIKQKNNATTSSSSSTSSTIDDLPLVAAQNVKISSVLSLPVAVAGSFSDDTSPNNNSENGISTPMLLHHNKISEDSN